MVLVTGAAPPGFAAATALASDSPSASSPTSAGSLRMSHHTSRKATTATPESVMAATRQPQATIRLSTTGMKMSCPVEPALLSRPSTTPRWRTNQRWATLAASTDEMPPAPVPTISPHTTRNCHSSLMNAVSPAPTANNVSAASITSRGPRRSWKRPAKGPMAP